MNATIAAIFQSAQCDQVKMINWEYVSTISDLPIHVIREFSDRLNWDSVSKHHEMTIPFAREFEQTLSWYDVGDRLDLSEEFILEFAERLDVWEMCQHRQFSEAFMMAAHPEDLDWDEISRHSENLSDGFLQMFIDYLNWEFVTMCRPIPVDVMLFVNNDDNACMSMYSSIWFYKIGDLSDSLNALARYYPEELEYAINWLYVSLFQEITPSLMRQFGKYLLWEYVSIRCDLSDAVITEFGDRLDWMAIAGCRLPVSFIRANRSRLPMTPQVRATIKNDHALMALRLPADVESLTRAYM